MCLPIDSCFGAPRTDDDLGPPNKQHVPPPSRGQRNGAGHYNGNGGAGGHYYNGNSYPAHGAAEADRKASNDVRPRGGHDHADTGVQAKAAAAYPYAGADGTLKQQPAASNGRVAAADGARGVAQRNHYYEPAHREDAADSYYPAATAHESPSEALGRE